MSDEQQQRQKKELYQAWSNAMVTLGKAWGTTLKQAGKSMISMGHTIRRANLSLNPKQKSTTTHCYRCGIPVVEENVDNVK